MSGINPLLSEIAKQQLNVPTLEMRGSDRLDFHELSAVSLCNALEAAFWAGSAYQAGRASAVSTGGSNLKPVEVGTIYVHQDDRWVVSFVMGYKEAPDSSEEKPLIIPEQAARKAFKLLTPAEDNGELQWQVFDRKTGETTILEVREFDEENMVESCERCDGPASSTRELCIDCETAAAAAAAKTKPAKGKR